MLRQSDSQAQLDFFSLHRSLNKIFFRSASDFAVDLVLMMPEQNENDMATRAQLLMQGTTSQSFNEHVKLALYCLSNDLIKVKEWTDEGRESWKLILNLIEHSGMTSQPLHLVQEGGLTIMSIAENPFKLCVGSRVNFPFNENHAFESKIISWLLHSGQNPNVEVDSVEPTPPLDFALQLDEFELAIELLDAGAVPNKSFFAEFPPLSNLLKDSNRLYFKGRREIFKRLVLRLLAAGVSLNEGPSDQAPSALMWAVCLDLHLADILIQHGAKIEHQFTQYDTWGVPDCLFSRTQSALGFAMYTINEDEAMNKIQQLLDHVQRSSPLISIADLITADVLSLAAASSFNKIIEFCCGLYKSTTTKQYELFSALCAASFKGRRATCELLIHYGAPINGPEELREIPCPLHFSALADHPSVTKLLYEHGADVNAEFKAGGGYAHARNYMWNLSL